MWMRLSFVGGISSLSIKIMMKVVKSEIYGQQEAITPWMSKRRLCTIGLDCSHIACDCERKNVPLGAKCDYQSQMCHDESLFLTRHERPLGLSVPSIFIGHCQE